MNYYDVSNGSRIQVGDSIPLYSDRIETNINLYYSSKSNQFFIVSHVFKDKDESNITIYSINNTPIPASLLADSKEQQETEVIRVTPMQTTLIGLGVLLIAGILLLVKKYKVKIIKKAIGPYRLLKRKIQSRLNQKSSPVKRKIVSCFSARLMHSMKKGIILLIYSVPRSVWYASRYWSLRFQKKKGSVRIN